MESIDLLTVCIAAFVAVFGLLAILALLMRLILIAFPEQEFLEETTGVGDAAIVAALTTVISNHFPGTKISKIEEIS